jgi:hypothetical protein
LAEAGEPVAAVNAHGVFTGQAETLEFRAGLSKKRPASLADVEIRVLETEKGWRAEGGWQFAKFGYGETLSIRSTPSPTRGSDHEGARPYRGASVDQTGSREATPATRIGTEIAQALKWVAEQRAKATMPLQPGKSREIVSQNIREFHGGPTYERTKKKFGKKTADKQAVAAALSNARRHPTESRATRSWTA